MVNYYILVIFVLCGQFIYIQFFNYKELKIDSFFNQVWVQVVLQVVNLVQLGNLVLVVLVVVVDVGMVMVGQSFVFRIIVENFFYFVILDVLYQIFFKFGIVLKIIIFIKNNQFQVLLQYVDFVSVQYVKLLLDGQNIYNVCCMLCIDFFKFISFNVKYNNDKSCDYICLDLFFGDSQFLLDQIMVVVFGVFGIILVFLYVGVGFFFIFVIF